jgi:hypothetical protein
MMMMLTVMKLMAEARDNDSTSYSGKLPTVEQSPPPPTHTHPLYFLNVRCSGEWTSLVFTNSSTIHTLSKYGSAVDHKDLL